MNQTKCPGIYLLLGIICSWIPSAPVHASPKYGIAPLEERLAKYDAVFLGRPFGRYKHVWKDGTVYFQRSLRVERTWKGAENSECFVLEDVNNMADMVGFEPNETFLVFGRTVDFRKDTFYTETSFGSSPVIFAGDDLQELEKLARNRRIVQALPVIGLAFTAIPMLWVIDRFCRRRRNRAQIF